MKPIDDRPIESRDTDERAENETELIQTYLLPLAKDMPGAFGLADDAALLPREPMTDLIVSTDPIVAGVHFFPHDRADDVAWKALAVNVSDIAAKGAKPVAYLLTLALPEAPTRNWLRTFTQGLHAAQNEFGCGLIGGDTDRTPGPLSIGVTLFGSLPTGTFVPRNGARPGDRAFVTGTVGDAALGLAIHRNPNLFANVLTDGDRRLLVNRYLRPTPRLALADAVREHANAAIDISDGLLKDLSRIAGPLGLTLKLDDVPLSPPARQALAADVRVVDAIIGGGDDYELIVAVPPGKAAGFAEAARRCGVSVTDVGCLESVGRIAIIASDGTEIVPRRWGYDHFSR